MCTFKWLNKIKHIPNLENIKIKRFPNFQDFVQTRNI